MLKIIIYYIYAESVKKVLRSCRYERNFKSKLLFLTLRGFTVPPWYQYELAVLLAKVIMHLHLRCRSDPIRKRRSCLPFALFTRWHSAQLNAFALLLLCFALAGTSFCFCLTWLRNLWRELMPCEWPWNVDLLSVWSREWRTRMSRSQAEIRGSPTWSRVNKQLPFALMRTVNTLCWGMNIIIITKGLIQISTDMLRYIYIYLY